MNDLVLSVKDEELWPEESPYQELDWVPSLTPASHSNTADQPLAPSTNYPRSPTQPRTPHPFSRFVYTEGSEEHVEGSDGGESQESQAPRSAGTESLAGARCGGSDGSALTRADSSGSEYSSYSFVREESLQQGESRGDLLAEPDSLPKGTRYDENGLHLGLVEFSGTLPRLAYVLHCLATFLHYPLTLYIDYIILYTIYQLTILSAPAKEGFILGSNSKAAWVALAFYGSSTLGWLFVSGVDMWRSLWISWGSRGTYDASQIYGSASAFNFTAMRSFGHFCLYQRIRLAPWQPASTSLRVEGATQLDGLVELCKHYRQNWTTAVFLGPRLAIGLILLWISLNPDSRRDSSYYTAEGKLTDFSRGIIIFNSAWALCRIILCVIASSVALAFALDEPISSERERRLVRRMRLALGLCERLPSNVGRPKRRPSSKKEEETSEKPMFEVEGEPLPTLGPTPGSGNSNGLGRRLSLVIEVDEGEWSTYEAPEMVNGDKIRRRRSSVIRRESAVRVAVRLSGPWSNQLLRAASGQK
ncbi:hypothetical protein T439DRAFT_353595 [Meredithblackwellia eburnea MCA 4105]